MFSNTLKKITIWVFFILIILAVWAVIIAISGENPFSAFGYILEGSLGDTGYFLSTLNKMVPIMLTALAVAIPSWAGIWNIGGEGQLLLGGFGAALIGFSINLGSGFLNILFALIVSALFGLVWALWPGYLKVKLNVDEVVTTLMGNYIASYFVLFLINYPFRDHSSPMAQTKYIDSSFQIPYMFRGSQFSYTFFIALGVVFIFYFIIRKFKFGYEIRMTGSNPDFSKMSGIKTKKIKLVSMLMGGAVAGLAGGLLVLGMNHRMMQSFSPGFGFTGLLVCLLAFNNPILIVFISFIFAMLQTGSVNLELFSNVPAEISGLLQAVMVLFVSAFKIISMRKGGK